MALLLDNPWNFVLKFGAVYGDNFCLGGSGFLAAFGLAITATHNFDRVFELLSQRLKGASSDSDYPVVAFQLVEEGSALLQWGVKSLFRLPTDGTLELPDSESTIDIALVEMVPLDPEKDGRFAVHRWRKPILSVAPPAVGTSIRAFGYVEGKDEDSFSVSDINWKFRNVRSEGVVEEVHFPFRDRSAMPFPCFQTTASFQDGMSGGPVLDPRGRICGVISRGADFPGFDDVSWASSIWPAMAMQIRKVSLYDLARDNVIRTEGLHRLKLTRIRGNDFPEISFDPNT